jgi:hypothetical protein
LADDAAAGEARHVRGPDGAGVEDGGRVVGHRLHGSRAIGHRRPAGSPIVEGGHAVAVPQSVQLELPRLHGVAEAADQQDVGSLTDLLGPNVEVACAYVLSHPALTSSHPTFMHTLGCAWWIRQSRVTILPSSARDHH